MPEPGDVSLHAGADGVAGAPLMGSRLSITPPGDYLLTRDVCSYGYFLLAPNRWDGVSRRLGRSLNLEDGIASLTIAQAGGKRGGKLDVRADRALSRGEREEAKRKIARMLRLDEESLAAFHRADPRWRRSGKGRLFRSPTLFEDVVKTVTSCNVTWPGTMKMNQRLCEVINPAFPTAGQLGRRRAATLRSRCGVGYRDQRLIELAKLFRSGEVEEAWFEDEARSDEEVEKKLRGLPGVGPYAAANIMMLLGRYGHLAIDTETIRHGREELGMAGTEAQVRKQLMAHYEQFGDQRFRSYWFESWLVSERRNGPAHTWTIERD